MTPPMLRSPYAPLSLPGWTRQSARYRTPTLDARITSGHDKKRVNVGAHYASGIEVNVGAHYASGIEVNVGAHDANGIEGVMT